MWCLAGCRPCCVPGCRLNKCGAISPRYDIAAKDIEAWVGRLLPSRQFGHIILTTSQGIMDHEEARWGLERGLFGDAEAGPWYGGLERRGTRHSSSLLLRTVDVQ